MGARFEKDLVDSELTSQLLGSEVDFMEPLKRLGNGPLMTCLQGPCSLPRGSKVICSEEQKPQDLWGASRREEVTSIYSHYKVWG